jgi:hypothetical protein
MLLPSSSLTLSLSLLTMEADAAAGEALYETTGLCIQIKFNPNRGAKKSHQTLWHAYLSLGDVEPRSSEKSAIHGE